ncbi:MAG TPA: ferritin-like domain-containing protein [Mycobacteriales bacterium]
MTRREVEALQGALAAEYAVDWGYDLVGGKVPTALQPAVRTAQAPHVDLQSVAAAAIRARHADPVAPQPAYQLPFPVTGEPSALRLAAHLEDGAAAAWRFLLGTTADRALRRTAAGALSAAAVQATRWRVRAGTSPASQPFPGM